MSNPEMDAYTIGIDGSRRYFKARPAVRPWNAQRMWVERMHAQLVELVTEGYEVHVIHDTISDEHITKLEAENAALRAFAQEVLHGWPATLGTKGLKYGLLAPSAEISTILEPTPLLTGEAGE